MINWEELANLKYCWLVWPHRAQTACISASSGLTRYCSFVSTSVVSWSISPASGWRTCNIGMRRTSGWIGRTDSHVRRRKIPAINGAGYGPSIFIAARPSTPVLHPLRGHCLRNNATWTVILAAPRDLRLDAQPFLRTFSSLPMRKYPWIIPPRINQQMRCSKLFLSGTRKC